MSYLIYKFRLKMHIYLNSKQNKFGGESNGKRQKEKERKEY